MSVSAGKLTVIRMRGHASIYLQSADAVGAGFQGAVGIGIATSAAVAAGVASVPTPIDEEDWDGWMFHTFFDIRAITATIADGVNAFAAVARIPIDSKAMRKFDEDMTMFGVWQVVESPNAVAEAQANVRLLTMLG